MQKHRYKVSFLLTTLFYTLLVAGYFLYISKQHFAVEQKPKEKVITLTLSEFIPPPKEEPIIEPIPEPVIEEVEPEVEEPEPKKKEPEPILKEEPVVPKLVTKAKPVVKKPIVQKPKKIKKKIKKRVKKKKVKKRSVVKRKKRDTKKSSTKRRVKNNPAKKSQFFSRLRTKINRAKSYPRIAQRRGMQGVVKVRFTILANGHVGNISISGPKVFHNSARSAVKRAFPISTKNAPFPLPTTVNLLLRYQLK